MGCYGLTSYHQGLFRRDFGPGGLHPQQEGALEEEDGVEGQKFSSNLAQVPAIQINYVTVF